MKTKRVAFLVFITLALAALVSVVQTLPPSPLPANAPATEFSAERAIRHIQVIAAQPRPAYPPNLRSAYEAAADYVLAELEDVGLETETQRIGNIRNTIGWIKGDSSSDIVLLTAHLDSAPQSPGATDDASGVAVLLETARALISDTPPRNTVMFLFTDAEEIGCWGAKAFINHHPLARNVRVVIGFDAGGISGPDVLTATSANNGWLIRQLVQAKNSYISGSSAINALSTTDSDFTNAFRNASFSGYAFSLYWDQRIHTPEDNIENLNPSSIQHQGYHALSLARHFGNMTPLTDPQESDAVYFSVLRLFIVSYSPAWMIAITIAVTGIFGGVLAYGLKRRILSLAGIGYGAFVLLVGLIVAPLPDVVLGTWISGITSYVADRSLNQPLQVSMIVLTTLALTMLWYYLSRRIKNMSIPDLTMGALVPMVIAMIGTSIAFPAISFAFTWPLLLSLLSNANWFYSYAHQKNSKTVVLGLLFSGATSILIVGPSLLLGLFDARTRALTLIFLGILCGFLVPQIHLMMGSTKVDQKQLQTARAYSS